MLRGEFKCKHVTSLVRPVSLSWSKDCAPQEDGMQTATNSRRPYSLKGLSVRVICAALVCSIVAALLCVFAGASWLMFLAPLVIPFGFLVYWSLQMAETCMTKTTGPGCREGCENCLRHCCYVVYSPESNCVSSPDRTRGATVTCTVQHHMELNSIPVPTYVTLNADQGTSTINVTRPGALEPNSAGFPDRIAPMIGHILLPPSYSSLELNTRRSSLTSAAESLPPAYSFLDLSREETELPPSYSSLDLLSDPQVSST